MGQSREFPLENGTLTYPIKRTGHIIHPVPLMSVPGFLGARLSRPVNKSCSWFSNGKTRDWTTYTPSRVFALENRDIYYPVLYMANDQIFLFEVTEIKSKIGLT